MDDSSEANPKGTFSLDSLSTQNFVRPKTLPFERIWLSNLISGLFEEKEGYVSMSEIYFKFFGYLPLNKMRSSVVDLQSTRILDSLPSPNCQRQEGLRGEKLASRAEMTNNNESLKDEKLQFYVFICPEGLLKLVIIHCKLFRCH